MFRKDRSPGQLTDFAHVLAEGNVDYQIKNSFIFYFRISKKNPNFPKNPILGRTMRPNFPYMTVSHAPVVQECVELFLRAQRRGVREGPVRVCRPIYTFRDQMCGLVSTLCRRSLSSNGAGLVKIQAYEVSLATHV